MRAVCLLLGVTLLLQACSGTAMAKSGESDAREAIPRSGPQINETAIEVAFDREEHFTREMFGNVSMQTIIKNNSQDLMGLRLSGTWRIYSIGGLTLTKVVVSEEIPSEPHASASRVFNLSLSMFDSPQLDSFLDEHDVGFISTFTVSVSNASLMVHSSNSTKIVFLAPYSIHLVDPVENEGSCLLRKDQTLDLEVNVTNHSNGTLNGLLSTSHLPGNRPISIGANRSQRFSIRVDPSDLTHLDRGRSEWEIDMTISIVAGNTSSRIGYHFLEGSPVNATNASIHLTYIDVLKIDLDVPRFEIGIPQNISIAITSVLDSPLTNVHFKFKVIGYMHQKMRNSGGFTLPQLIPGVRFNVSYPIEPQAAGQFELVVSTRIQDTVIRQVALMNCSTRLSMYTDLDQIRRDNDGQGFVLNTKLKINCLVENTYPQELSGVSVLVKVLNVETRGLVDVRDLITVDPESFSIEALTAGERMGFTFNVTFTAPGQYTLHVIATWEGNATPGGVDVGVAFSIWRPPAGAVLNVSAAAIPILAVVPKILDAVIRHKNEIPFF